MTILLDLQNVKVSYGGAKILNGVSMSVEEGTIVCLIGANGAGKTTTLRTISGLTQPDSGEIKYRGQTIIGMRPQKILSTGIAHVPQEGRLFRDMTVYENLAMGAYLQHDKAQMEADLYKIYEYFPVLKARLKQKADKMSGGERQMLAIARALLSKPRVLMMDEPTSGLAPIMVKTVGEITSMLNTDGISILMVEQNAEFALKIAHYGYVMERGKVVLEGKTNDLLTNNMVKEAYLGI